MAQTDGLPADGLAQTLVSELDRVLAHPSRDLADAAQAKMLRRVTDLFLLHADSVADEQVALFDEVILRLAGAIETQVRSEIAARLAPLPNAPRKTLRKLAHDEIAVARPILVRSPRLTDDDLISVAVTRGRDHMIAMTEREKLPASVTDVLIREGDPVVVHAVALNQGASLSAFGLDRMIERAAGDELLNASLRKRVDLPPGPMAKLFGLAKDLARNRLQASAAQAGLLDAAREGDADDFEEANPIVIDRARFKVAAATIARAFAEGQLSEHHVADWAAAGRAEEVICAIAALASLPLPMVMRIFTLREHGGLLVIGRRLEFEWPTLHALLNLMASGSLSQSDQNAFELHYASISPATAERVLRFMHMRETSKAAG